MPELLSTRYLSGTETLFRGIHRLLPGHLLVFEDGIVTTKMWWDVPFATPGPTTARLSDKEAVGSIPSGLEDAVRHAADGGRAARHVPLGRARQQRDCRADGAA